MDPFNNYADDLDSPASHAVEITPSQDEITHSRAIYIGVAGHLHVRMHGKGDDGIGREVVFRNMPVGFHPIRVSHIFNGVDTTAENIIAVW